MVQPMVGKMVLPLLGGSPAAGDPSFLSPATNAAGLVFLLGYPLFIEPSLRIIGQNWLWAVGFAVLVVMIFVCGRAAAHPIGVPPAAAKFPAAGKGGGKSN